MTAWGNRIDLALALITDRPRTFAELLGVMAPIGKGALLRMLLRLRTASNQVPRRAHIASWVLVEMRNRQTYVAVYAAGDQPDVKRPAAKTRKRINREAWKRRVTETAHERDARVRFAVGLDLQRAWQSVSGCTEARESAA